MKNILGLDLGSSSVGWAVVGEDEEHLEFVAMGERIVPMSVDELSSFTQGSGESVNAGRTRARSQRKGYDRYQLRRTALLDKLKELGMQPGESLVGLPKLQLWELRAKAVSEQIGLNELGRVLLHLNQKRGYKSTKSDLSGDKKATDYVKAVNNRYDELNGRTIGQRFYEELSRDFSFRCKEQIYPRKAYIEEFDKIIACQRVFYPEVLTDENIHIIRDEIIYYQRSLKSCKHLVSVCEFEKRPYSKNGKIVYGGPKVAPRTSPLFQVCRLWESINNIKVENWRARKKDEQVVLISIEKKRELFEFMNSHEKLKSGDVLSILGLKRTQGYRLGDQFKTGIQGNKTRVDIANALGDYPDKERLLRFDLKEIDSSLVDVETGEILPIIDSSFEQEPLYQLWHALYSIDDTEQLAHVLREKFTINDDAVIERLCALDFVKAGFSNKSSRAMRRILPFLQEGEMYSNACYKAGFNHSNSLTKTENQERELLDKLPAIQKNELRQPTVEKILNQMINVVNALMAKYGRFDEIRVELARELKQSKEERNKAYGDMNKNQRENERIARRITEEYGLIATRSRIQKYKLWEESEHRCVYCGAMVNVSDFLQGFAVEVEHIIPKSLYFNDSFSNKACACRSCNSAKGNKTAYDFMAGKGDALLNDYKERVNEMINSNKISKTKGRYLLTSLNDIPTDFIDRQLRESQFIAKKAREILSTVCREVTATSGAVTDFLRHTWGWDMVLHNLHIEQYKEVGLTELVEVKHKDSMIKEERIKGWTKRLDHRHHAIDALTIACTKQGYIQRMNTLSTLHKEAQEEQVISLERYIQEQPHFSVAEVQEAARKILVSFKPGKRSVTPGKRYVYKKGKRVVVQDGLLIPRGALSEESVYGIHQKWEKDKKGNPVLNKYTVIKYPITSIDRKRLESVVDGRIRQLLSDRLTEFNDNAREAFAQPVYFNDTQSPIRSVRCYARPAVDTVVPVKRDENGRDIGWVMPGNNHHIAIYQDEKGKYQELSVPFWRAVERRQKGLPAIITNPQAVWDSVQERDDLTEEFMASLPDVKWQFLLSLQQNEMFILGMSEEEYRYAMEQQDYALLNQHLYRVQKITSGMYYFRYHIETTVDDKYDGQKNESLSIQMGKMKRICSIKALLSENPHKVHISILGEIKEMK